MENRSKEEIHLIYSSFGKNEFYRQTILSVFSLFNKLKEDGSKVKIHLFTDNIDYFKTWFDTFPISYTFLSKEKLVDYMEDIKFIHLLKINIIKNVVAKFSGKIMYIDSDTFFLQNPITIFEKIDHQHSILEHDEYAFTELENAKDILHKKSYHLFKDNSFKLIDGSDTKISIHSRSFCAGVIGFHSSNKQWLGDIIFLTKQIYNQLPIFTAEQWSVSHILQSNSKVSTTTNVLFHYWRKEGKFSVDQLTKKMMRRNFLFKNKVRINTEIDGMIMKDKFEGYIYSSNIFVRLKRRIGPLFDKFVFKI